MAKHRQRLCRICHKNPVWTHGDVMDSQGTCKRCYHKHVWVGRPPSRRERNGAEPNGHDPAAFGETDMEALGYGVRREDLE